MAIPTQSAQKPNIIIRNRIQLGEFVQKIPMFSTTLIEGEWVYYATTGWARAVDSTQKDTAIISCYPVIGKPAEHMNQTLRAGIRDNQGAVPIYMGPWPLIVDTKLYDSADTLTAGVIVNIGSITDGTVTRAGITDALNGNGVAAGRVMLAPADNNGWLRVLITFG